MTINPSTVPAAVKAEPIKTSNELESPAINNGLLFQDLVSLVKPELASSLCVSQGRLGLYDSRIAHEMVPELLSRVASLPSEGTLVIDFAQATTGAAFLFTLLQSIYFPRTSDGPTTDRPVKQKKVVIANPDESTLLGISQCLELVNSHCMVITNTTEVPWKLLHVGHLEPRLEALLRQIHDENGVTVKSLVTNELRRRRQMEHPKEIQTEVLALSEAKETKKFNVSLKELYDFGLVNREKINLPGQRSDSYRYTFYHPFQHHIPSYHPVEVQFYRMPRPPRTKKEQSSGVAKVAEEPEPLLNTRVERRRQHHLQVVQILDECLGHPEAEVALHRAASTWRYWQEAREALGENEVTQARSLIQEVLHRALSHDPSQQHKSGVQVGRIFYIMGVLSPQTQQWQQPKSFYSQCLSHAMDAQDAHLEALGLSGLGRLHAACSEYDKAAQIFEQATQKAEIAGDKALVGRLCLRRGRVAVERNNYQLADEFAHQGLLISKITGDAMGEIKSLILLGKIQGNQANRAAGYEYYQQAQQLCSRFGYQRLSAIVDSHVSVLDWNNDDRHNHRAIVSHLSKAVDSLHQLGDTRHEAHALINLVASLTEIGEYKRAYVDVFRALSLCQAVSDRRALAFVLEEIARLSSHLGETADEMEAVRLRAYAKSIRQSINSDVTPEQKLSYNAYVAGSRQQLSVAVANSITDSIKFASDDEAIDYALATIKRHSVVGIPQQLEYIIERAI